MRMHGEEKELIIGEYNKSVILTYIGIGTSSIGIWFAIYGEIKYAFICLIFAGICDLFDGVIARRCKRSPRAEAFGIQLDSLADVFSFLALPTVICFALLDQWGIIGILYVIAGIIRLAWFNVISNEEGTQKYFIGLPVTYSALILPLYYLLYLINQTIFPLWGFFLIYLAVSVAYIAKSKIRKPRGLAYIFFAALAILMTVGIIMV